MASWNGRLRDAGIVVLSTLILWVFAELLIRGAYALRNTAADVVLLPYTAAQDWGPVPPWIDPLRILEPDPVLLWRNRLGVERTYLDVYGPVHGEADRLALMQRFIPWVPASLRGRPVWSVAINGRGFRTEPFETKPRPSTLRIVCLGDSWTFGANVDQPQAYPQRLAALVEAAHPELDVEVMNLGVMGYTSRQGLELLRRQVLELEPDFLLIGFGMNDSIVAGWRDADSVGEEDRRPRMAADWLERLETLRLARYLVQRFRHEPWTIGDYLERVSRAAGTAEEIWTGRQAAEYADYDALETLARVSPADYEGNLTEMVRLSRSAGAGVVLLYNELWDTPYRDAVARVARSVGVSHVDAKSLLDVARRELAQDLEARLGLRPTRRSVATEGAELVFRVHTGGHPVPETLYIAGSHPSLGNAVPNRVALHDDGTHGDQVADDDVWSLAAAIPPGTRLFYTYTNSGREGRWEGLDVPDLRHVAAPGSSPPARRHLPIETFGALALQADGWHTNAQGYELIARAALDALRLEPGWPRTASPGGRSDARTSRGRGPK